jgi:hypothetical protein
MARIDELASDVKMPITSRMVVANALGAGRLLLRSTKMQLMMPTQFAFAFMAAFENAYVSPSITASVIGNASIGYFAGIVAGTAALIAFFAGVYIEHTGIKWPMMLLGGVAFIVELVPFLFADGKAAYFSPAWKLVLVYGAQGVGRGICESTNKAVIADYFPEDASAGRGRGEWRRRKGEG